MDKAIDDGRDRIRTRLEPYINIDEDLVLRDELFTIADEFTTYKAKIESLKEYLVDRLNECVRQDDTEFEQLCIQDILQKLEELDK